MEGFLIILALGLLLRHGGPHRITRAARLHQHRDVRLVRDPHRPDLRRLWLERLVRRGHVAIGARLLVRAMVREVLVHPRVQAHHRLLRGHEAAHRELPMEVRGLMRVREGRGSLGRLVHALHALLPLVHRLLRLGVHGVHPGTTWPLMESMAEALLESSH